MTVKLLSGEVLENRYRLGGRLGGGNFGTVYRAEELLNGVCVREVALKLYTPEATRNGDVEGMFSDCALPAKILSSTQSMDIKRHFVQIFGWGKLSTSAGVCAYVAMELVKSATTMQDLIDRHNRSGLRPTEDEVLDKMKQFFQALAAAHGAGVLHRDIKGANVMLSDGVVKIVDFGMGARMADGHTPLKTSISIYAPENFNGKYTAASDIYQAGLMFYQYWTGAQPFERDIPRLEHETDAAYNHRAMGEAQRMRIDWRYQPGSDMLGMAKSERLDAILAKCLMFLETERYENALVILPALEKENLKVAQGAWAAGNAAFAEESALSVLTDAKTTDKERVELYRLLGDIQKEQSHFKEAKNYYLEAYKLADKTGAYFLAKPRMRELLTLLVDCLEATGQKGMAGHYRKKINNY